jgi:hypothetical protein
MASGQFFDKVGIPSGVLTFLFMQPRYTNRAISCNCQLIYGHGYINDPNFGGI